MYTLACSHTRAWKYFAESVYRTSTVKPFKSYECGVSPASADLCVTEGNSMGYHATKPMFPSRYFTPTASASPYSLS